MSSTEERIKVAMVFNDAGRCPLQEIRSTGSLKCNHPDNEHGCDYTVPRWCPLREMPLRIEFKGKDELLIPR